MEGFHLNMYELTEPWRWKSVNEKLGLDLKQIRILIKQGQNIDLKKFSNVELILVENENDVYDIRKEYYKKLSVILRQDSILLLHPDTTSVHPRKKMIKGFKLPITLLEAIDEKEFYSSARLFDTANRETVSHIIYNIALKLFNKTEVNKWFNEKGLLKSKKNLFDKQVSDNIKEKIDLVTVSFSFIAVAEILRHISTIKDIRCYRKELYSGILKALEQAALNKSSVYDAMIGHRNYIRRVGRKIYGRCIGTTLLTKGLEFETVVVLNAHKFTCPKNLYVALTRASKRLIVFSVGSVLKPEYF
jgi:DNA helicase-2/ATP-dependent DNA helicase PcrA